MPQDGAASGAPQLATEAVLMPSEKLPEGTQQIKGVNFEDYPDREITVRELVESYVNMGFQGSNLAEAVRIINEMVREPRFNLLIRKRERKRKKKRNVVLMCKT
jgi:hypothetical protein